MPPQKQDTFKGRGEAGELPGRLLISFLLFSTLLTHRWSIGPASLLPRLPLSERYPGVGIAWPGRY